ncbi:MAG: KOW domain-containing RNA-binding protein [Desulfotomaculaceae bacterium]|nr:KOW domain-containing RNA-binding protein [Desulfotomaculaceae bacterium]
MTESVASIDGFETAGNRLSEAGVRNMVQIGHLVSSIKGRDRGKYYLVVDILSQSMVLVADGEERKVENPKRKNIKHLHFFETTAGNVSNKFMSGRRVTNMDIRNEIKSLADN